jgi:predicted  nucleic acid-binding Zn-ribbon protein
VFWSIVARRKIVEYQAAANAASTYSNQVTMKRINLEQLEREYRQRSEELTKLRSQLERYVPPGVTVISLSGAK